MKQIRITTSMGIMRLELDEDKAPQTVANFLDYVAKGHYSNTIFHRVIGNFMIQGGGFEAQSGMNQKPAEQTVINEAKNGLQNNKYSIAMARTSDPHSGSAQFFINTTNNDFLNYPGQDGWGYCVFGKVTDGFDVVDRIKEVKTRRVGMFADVPLEEVVIVGIEVL